VPPVYSDPVDGSYTLMAPAGSYSLTATATGYQAEAWPIDLDGDLQQDFDLEPVCLLVVDSGGEPSYLEYYTTALDRLALSYAAANQLPDLENLAFYRGVIWFTGDGQSGSLAPADLETMAAYLDGGGRLFLSGQNVAQEIGHTVFFAGYLGAESFAGTAGADTLVGLDFLAGLNPVISGGDGADNQFDPGILGPLPGATAVLRYEGTPEYGAVAYAAVHRAVTFAFGYEAINNPADRDQALAAVVDYMGACQAPEAPQAAFTTELLPEHGRIHLTNASQGTPLMQYEWAFGDGSTSTATHSVHQYAAPGAYTVTLTAANTFGTGTVAMPVSIEPLGPIALQYEPAHPGVGEEVVFTAAVDQPYDVSYSWDFGDGNTAAGSIASHAYATAGTYTVTVTASSTLETVSTTVNLTVADPVPSEWRLYLPFAAKP
jgi:PKD repeat protein